jgi:hypothetical protein
MDIFVSESAMKTSGTSVDGSLVDLDGECFYRVTHSDAMAPFLMSLVSASDHWCFLSSNGALTAGRKDPDHALFPYYTDDRIHEGHDTGGLTLLRVTRGGRTSLWEPFSQRYQGLYALTRNLYKSGYGNQVIFEEVNHDLGLTFRCAWMTSERYGFVRRATLIHDGGEPVAAEVLDGLQNLLPAGLDRRFQLEYSTLADGYKRTELLPGTGLALFCLSSIPTDRAEPSESLRANLAWSTGLPGALHLLSSTQVEAFRTGAPLQEERDLRGRRGAYLLNATLDLAGGERRDWLIVLEAGQDATQVRALRRRLETPEGLAADVMEDVAQGTRNLVRLVASADGLQVTGDPFSTWRHFSNALFNIMRGGVPDEHYQVPRRDLEAFLATANPALARRHAHLLASLPEALPLSRCLEALARAGDPDLDRLASEYLPLTFSRRHGDPSRPWNIFSIQVKDEHGRKRLAYEGNWRDLFQNWEALGHAYPGFLRSMVFKFLDCSTVDGHNPYRVTRDGFEWETLDPHDAWSFIGYWGDHQVIYLLKLLEASERFHPGGLADLLERRVFTFADVPYRLKPYEAMLATPRSTITFDAEAHDRAMARCALQGSDGMTLPGTCANLAEKLLLVALAKLCSYIPEAGIWMNTQRPEWNDANNALVGAGVSVVTLCHLRRYLSFCCRLFERSRASAYEFSVPLATLFEEIAATLDADAPGSCPPAARRTVLDALGRAGSRYREQVYAGRFKDATVNIHRERLTAFCARAALHLDHSIRTNRRDDGLYHAYNLMSLDGEGIQIRRLHLMLEGQVAALSSGALDADQALELLDALRRSALYREDQASYLLYPDRSLPTFLSKNNLPEAAVEGSPLLRAMIAAGDTRLASRDLEGLVHFNAAFRNAGDLKEALEGLSGGPYRDLALAGGEELLATYEQVFDHQAFTGRSGAFYKYEGLGCIYWHMVSKLLLAVDEVRRAVPPNATSALARLNAHYHEIREGIGVHKSPAAYGAIPTDPYSHTPGFAGVQQPGMTGQVKEDLLSRLSELGVEITGGRIAFLPHLIQPGEFLAGPAPFHGVDLAFEPTTLNLEAGSYAFTLCQVPVVAHRLGEARIQITMRGGSRRTLQGLEVDPETSAAIFGRTGEVERLDVFLGLPD